MAQASLPFKRDFGSLKQAADRDRKGLMAVLALVESGARGLALERVMIVYRAAMRADTTIRPYLRLKILAGFFGVLKMGLC